MKTDQPISTDSLREVVRCKWWEMKDPEGAPVWGYGLESEANCLVQLWSHYDRKGRAREVALELPQPKQAIRYRPDTRECNWFMIAEEVTYLTLYTF